MPRFIRLGGRLFTLIAGLLLLAAGPLSREAEAQEGNLVDGIAAVVGDSVILLSQVNERILQLQYQGVEVPTDPRCADPAPTGHPGTDDR